MNIQLTADFVDQCIERAELYQSSPEKVMCEIYEDHMIKEGHWKEYDGWEVDGIGPALGRIDVKMLEPGKSPWWNIPVSKGRNIFRQHGIVDHYLFIRADKDMSEYNVGDWVEIEVIGHMSWADVAKNIQISRTHGYYVDTRRAKKAIKQ